MNRDFPEELISAYLDGRVTADERVRVEEALAGSVELRRLHSDLQRVQSGLRQLPRFSLPADFADRVVQRIEQHPLHRSATLPTVAAPARTQHTSRTRWRSWNSVAVTAASLAAVLLLSSLWVSNQDRNPKRGDPVPAVASSERTTQEGDSLVANEQAIPDGSHLIAGVNEFQAAGPIYVFIVDLAITPEGQQQEVFQQVLQRAGIQFNPEVGVDEVLEKALLASRFIGDVEVVNPQASPAEKPAQDEIEMYYVTGLGDQVDAAITDLRTRPKEHIARHRFDMAIEPAERQLFEQLNSAVRMADSRKVPPAPQAYRLAFRFALRSGSAGFLGTFSQPLIRAEVVPAAEKVPAPAAVARKAKPSSEPQTAVLPIAADLPVAGGSSDPNDDENTFYEVLFILRNLE